MARTEKVSNSQRDGVQYRRAKTWHIALSQLYNGAGICFYVLMSYATYIGNAGYGILVAVTGFIITASRVFDGITDPICAFIIERSNFKFGKIRFFMMLGWVIMSLATTTMCTWGAEHLSGTAGLIFFIVCYFIYILGYTLVGVSTNITGNVMTNDPAQRPALSVWGTIYSYLVPMVISTLSMAVILPRFNDEIGIPFLTTFNAIVIAMSFVMYLLACVGITPYDKPENFEGIQVGKSEESKPGLKEMVSLIKDNKELQRYMIAACSDKLAQTAGSAAVVSTMLFGILIGNMGISSIISAVAMLPSIIFAIIGARLAGKQGNKKVMVQWTWASIVLYAVFAVFLLVTDTTQITKAIIPTAFFFIFAFGSKAMNMVVSTATSAMRMDVVDYELYRSGRYLPATVSATYSFVDKLISSFGATIATAAIALIGYTTVAPQPGDPLTMGVRIMTVALYCGLPILGWVCTIVAMKGSELSKERMVEVQKDIAEKKAAAQKS